MVRAIAVIAALILIFINVIASENINVDQCDWFGSGGGERGVRSVYLRCDRGKILWHYPHAALRVVLAIPISTSVTDLPRSPADSSGFRACVKISGPVRVFLEADGKLRQLYSPSDDKREFSYRYFHSRNDTIALYMEAEDNYSAKNARVRLQYDLEPNSLKGGVLRIPNEEEECRPCSMEELATAYCQSDLVARGTLSAVQQQLDSDTAQLVLTVTKILRQVVQETEGNEIVSAQKNIYVRVPAACDARHGLGEFVIMAKRRLGDLTLVCAPRLEMWAQVVREMDTAPCLLKS